MLSWLPGDCNHKPANKNERLCGSHTPDREQAKEPGLGPGFPARNAIAPVTAMDVLWASLMALSLTAPRQVQAKTTSPAVPWNSTPGSHENTSAEPGPSGEGSVRLLNGSNPCSGSVEVRYFGQWIPVCQEMWDMEASHVVCRQLHCGEAKEAVATPTPSLVCPPRSARIKETTPSSQSLCPSLHIRCTGLESTWEQCNMSLAEQCCGGRPASVTCTGSHSVRLVGGDSCCEGLVEVEEAGVWGTVCDDAWDLDDASVVCQQLRCGWAVEATVASSFQKGTGPIHLDEVGCAGNEAHLWDCPANRTHDCGHKEDAGVVCSEHQKWRLSGSCAGRVEAFYQGVWNTVCDGTWYKEEMDVLCQWLGCGPSLDKLSFNHTHHGRMNYQCKGGEASLSWCRWHYNNLNLCHQSQAAGVVCNGSLGLLNMSDVPSMGMTTPANTQDGKGTARPLCWEATFLSNQTLLLLCVVLGFLLLVAVLAFTTVLLRMRKQHAHTVSSSSSAAPVLMNHSAQGPETAVGGSNDYRKVPSHPPKAEEPPAVPAPGSEDSDSDYEHYDFSSKPPVALSTFYNSLRHRPADETLPASGFPPAPSQEMLSEAPEPWGLAEQRPHEGSPAEFSSSSENTYYNSSTTRQPEWSNSAPPPAGNLLAPPPPALGNSGSQLSFQGATSADSSSTSSGEWYENYHSTAHQEAQPADMSSSPAWPALPQPLGSCEPGNDSSEDSDYDDIQGLAY